MADVRSANTGAKSSSQVFANNQNSRFDPHFIQRAVVMDNRDATMTGKLKVWVDGSQSPQDAKDSWLIASYSPPFAGRTPGVPGAGSYQQYPKGYGFWAVPPDVGCTVYIFFVNGNIHDCCWFSCGYDERMNSMVPGVATQVLPNAGHNMPTPVTDYDRNTIETDVNQKYMNVPLVEGLKKQNLLYDEQKGLANRSSTRSMISNVYGMSTPRGNSFILDDGIIDSDTTMKSWDEDQDTYQDTQFSSAANDTSVGSRKSEGIVLRTRSGAQFLLSESDGNVFIINRDGTARIEMTADGQIFAHSDNSITIRTDKDFNLSVAQDMNVEIGKNFNLHVQGDNISNIVGKLNSTITGDVVVNTGADLRLLTSGSIRMQSGSSTNITSGSNTAITSSSTVDISGSGGVHIEGAGAVLSLNGSVTSSTAIYASDFKSGSIGLNDHIHVHAQFTDASNHSNEMAPPTGGGGTGNATSPAQAAPANDVTPSVPVQTSQDAVQYINSTSQVSQTLSTDLTASDDAGSGTTTVSYTTTYESLQFLMPCTGTIREYGYWGKDVPTQAGGKTSRYGWIIQAKGNVVAPYDGTATKLSNGGLVITHQIGYKSVFYDINSTIADQQIINKGDVIGTANGVFEFEIRTASANLFGFSGTVDPGHFYKTVTGEGADAANKALTVGVPSNPNARAITSSSASADSSELVVITKVTSIGSAYSQRGSKHSPTKLEDLSNLDKTAIGWKVTPSDKQLLDDIMAFEGSQEAQSRTGSFRNGKFYQYPDPNRQAGNDIGYGHLLDTPATRAQYAAGITPDEAKQLLITDLVRFVTDAKRIYAKYKMQTPYMVQIVLVEMCYQMGTGKVVQFTQMLLAMARGDYKAAAASMRASLWYRQTTRRAEVLARRVEACQ